MRVTLGELLGRVTAKQGHEIERELEKRDIDPAEERAFQGSESGHVQVVEVVRKRVRR